MQKTKEVQAGCLYIFQGRSCAREEIIRNLESAQEFITSANERFKGYMKIRDYCLAQDTWTLLVELEDQETIRSSYLDARKKSKKAKAKHEHKEIWKMTSECVRHWLSRFVKLTNVIDGREGSLRLRTYERYFFESYEEASSYIESMKQQLIGIPQSESRFRPNRKKWRLRKVGLGHVYLCSKGLSKAKELQFFGAGAIVINTFCIDVLRKLTNLTLSIHFDPKTQISTPKIE